MTELIWEGKYDKDNRKSAPVRIALPFQTIETVNESTADRERTRELFAQGQKTDWRNRLIWGDKKYVLPSLLAEFAGKVDLIYIDPPFDTGADFSFTTKIPESDRKFTKEPSIIEQKAYRDTWGRGLDGYLKWFYDTISLLRDLLSETGSIYVHLDWHAGHYAKIILDEVFGRENFRNEIVWSYNWASTVKRTFSNKHDILLWYSKTDKFGFNLDDVRIPLTEKQLKGYKKDSKGFYTKGSGGKKWYAHPKGQLPKDVFEIGIISRSAYERTGYPTQKPEKLLERIIKASSNPGDLVLDCFAGSGTTLAVAEKLDRRWIGADLGRFAIHTTRKRLLEIPNVKPFVVQNLGKYERQAWMGAEFDNLEHQAERQFAYRNFILELYSATPINGYAWLHGVRAGRMVHVGSVDAPITIGDVKSTVIEFQKLIRETDVATENGIDILGWDFSFELNEVVKQMAGEARIDLKFKRIPREVLEPKAVDQGDIQFFELAALSVDLVSEGKSVVLKLIDFVIPPDDVPADVQSAIEHWSQWIDYWAIDWDFKGDTFHNEWQSYRTKKDPAIQKQTTHKYDEAGTYTIVVKVIDILGNDTTKLVEVEIS